MTSLLISIVLWILRQGAPNQIAERNRLKIEAGRAFAEGDYALAASLYRRLSQSALLPESAVLFNEAQACFALNDTSRARALYIRLTRVDDVRTAASALSQLGVLACRSGDSTLALVYFERALRTLSTHESARYNYELLRKILPSDASPRQRVVGNATRRRPESAQPSASTTALPTQRRRDVLKKLEGHQLTEQKARMLLDAMRAEEIQYIQQRRYGAPPEAESKQQTW